MCLVLGIVGDEEVASATKRALAEGPPLRLIDAAAELPGAIDAHRPLVIVASPKDRFGDPVIPHLSTVRKRLPQVGVVLISDVGVSASHGIWDLSSLGEIRSVSVHTREYAASLQRAVEQQAERYRTEYILRAFAPHTPPDLQPLLHHCARRWGKRLSAEDVAAALGRDRHTVLNWVKAAQSACQLRDVLRLHHVADITWEFCARGRPFKLLARDFGYLPASRLNASLRHWLGIDLRKLGSAGVRAWEDLIDRLVDELTGQRRTRPCETEPLQR